jgi:hypothetical protein
MTNRLHLRLAAAVLLCMVFSVSVPAQQQGLTEERLMATMHMISSHTLNDYVREMASEKYQGRLTGTPGFDAAAQWAIKLLSDWKIKPAGDNGTYLQKFPNPYTLVLPGAELVLNIPIGTNGTIKKKYLFEQDFFPGATSDSGTVTAEVVYVGYGITAPELDYDEYRGVDVRGKLVLVEPESPVGPDPDPNEFKKWRPYSFHDYKVKNAAAHGAAGMVYDYHISNPNAAFVKGLVLTYVGPSVVEDLFAGTGKKHDEVVKAIRSTLKPASFALGKSMTMKCVTEHHPEGVGANVIGMIEGSDPELTSEYIIVGAHLDHLGLDDQMMPGANDNASGVAVTLGVAEALARLGVPYKRSVLVILFGAEEQGVRGSEYYVAHPVVPNDHVKGFFNMETVGRGEQISAGGGKNYPQLWEVIDRNNQKYIHRQVRAGFTANLARPRQDAAHFMWASIPSISFGVGGAPSLPYATYHTTKDNIDIITPEIMEDLARLTFLCIVDMAK